MGRVTVFVYTEIVFKLIIKSFVPHVWYAKPKILQNKCMPGLLLVLGGFNFCL